MARASGSPGAALARCADSLRVDSSPPTGFVHLVGAGPGAELIPVGRRHLDRLIRAGRTASTPAAWIEDATQPSERIVVGTLANLAAQVGESAGGGPALVIVGEVVTVRARLAAAGDRLRRRPFDTGDRTIPELDR